MPNFEYIAAYPLFYPGRRDHDGQSLMAQAGMVVEWDAAPDPAVWAGTDKPVTWGASTAPPEVPREPVPVNPETPPEAVPVVQDPPAPEPAPVITPAAPEPDRPAPGVTAVTSPPVTQVTAAQPQSWVFPGFAPAVTPPARA